MAEDNLGFPHVAYQQQKIFWVSHHILVMTNGLDFFSILETAHGSLVFPLSYQ
jgi:hypothetical protein